MKAAPFEYVAPSSLEETLAWLARAEGEARLIAGGQSLVPLMAFRLAEPSLLVDLRRIQELRRVEVTEDGVLLGAMVTQAATARIEEIHPLVRSALPLIGHQQIRNRGTVGGSMAHADPAAELPAVAVALGAEMVVRTRSGSRRVSAEEFFVGHFTTVLGGEEVLEAVWFPRGARGEGEAILEVGRSPGDFALAGVAARLRLNEDNVVTEASVVPFAVGDRPRGSVSARQRLIGSGLSEGVTQEVAEEVAGEIHPASDMHATGDYRRHVVGVLTARALAGAAHRAGRAA
jgi:carbon-monoxide dehydrogenase medium subunit